MPAYEPLETIEFFVNYLPSLEAGSYQIKVEQDIEGVDTQGYFSEPITQDFVVAGPQFTLDAPEVHSQFPPAGSAGAYADVLPNVVLSRRVLPWERLLVDGSPEIPWLALLLFQANELTIDPETNSPLVSRTVRELLTPNGDVLKPAIEADKLPPGVLDSYCQTLTLSAAVFKAVLPRLQEVAYLAHCRQISTATNQVLPAAPDGVPDLGWFGVVVANRFPQSTDPDGTRNYAQLVSLEGFAAYLVDNPSLPAKASNPAEEVDVMLVSLNSWSFVSLPENGASFADLCANFVAQENGLPANLLLRLPQAGALSPTDNTGWNTLGSEEHVLTVQLNSTQPGAPVVGSPAVGGLAAGQLWQWDGEWLINKQNGFALDVASGALTVGSAVVAAPRDPQSLTQQWVPYGHLLRNRASNLVLTLTDNDTTNGRLVTIIDATDYPNQQWVLTAAPALAAADQEAATRLTQGYVPLSYETRLGEATFAWYRGPLVPVIPQPLPVPPGSAVPDQPYFASSAAASIYDQRFGVFDQSYAAAWEIGRAAALADGYFTSLLLRFRHDSHQLINRLLDQSGSPYAAVAQGQARGSAPQLAALVTTNLARQRFNQMVADGLAGQLAETFAMPPPEPPLNQRAARRAAPPTPSRFARLQAFVQQPAVLAVVQDELQATIDAIAEWLAKLNLLYFLPFNHLVPDQRMLPPEAIRFFYLDQNWLNVLTDGALSVALQGTFDLTVRQRMDSVLIAAMNRHICDYRTRQAGSSDIDVEADSPLEAQSGLLIRSALVSGWPGLQLKASKQGVELKILRLDRVGTDVLLCLCLDVPDTVTLSEPYQGLSFGVEDGSVVQLRSLQAPVGQPLGQTFPSTGGFTQFMRPAAGDVGQRVLNVYGDQPSATAALVPQFTAALHAPGTIDPADLAIQLVRAPESLSFNPLAS